MAGKNGEQRPKKVDDFTVFQANTIYQKLQYERGQSSAPQLLARGTHKALNV
jgi:hypothetical protein